jgi:VIT1/CCC1 family predicted Fe2+/Mn2+ transporter
MSDQNKRNSGLVKDIIIGMSDGLTVPFALTAGLSGALHTNQLIIVSGMAEIAAGCISMGLGGFLAGESEIDHYNTLLQREYHEIETVPHLELQEVEDALTAVGVDGDLSKAVALQISQNKDNWANFMMQVELKMEKPVANRASVSAFTIAVSYLVGGFVPLFPYLITRNNQEGLYLSCFVTIIALLIFGYLKSKFTGQNLLRGTLKVASIGIIAAAAAFLLAKAVS